MSEPQPVQLDRFPALQYCQVGNSEDTGRAQSCRIVERNALACLLNDNKEQLEFRRNLRELTQLSTCHVLLIPWARTQSIFLLWCACLPPRLSERYLSLIKNMAYDYGYWLWYSIAFFTSLHPLLCLTSWQAMTASWSFSVNRVR